MPKRSFLIDALKVLAAQLIVLHHIVLYTPMAKVLAGRAPRVSAFFLDEARFVVQVFLVIGGYLAAQALSRGVPSLPRALLARWLRLVPMLAVALLAVLAASSLLPPGRWPDWVTRWPTLGQFVAHLLLLQDVLDMPSLSAGAWYVAIDFQLFALLVAAAAALPRAALPWAVAALALASLGVFSRDERLDAWAPYFFGAYGLGALAAWAARSRRLAWLFGLVCAAALALAWAQARPRLALACLTAIALVAWATRQAPAGHAARWLARCSDASYGVFLIHFALIVATTALWLRWRLDGAFAASVLLGLCWGASLMAGAVLQRVVGGAAEARLQSRRSSASFSPSPTSTAPLPR